MFHKGGPLYIANQYWVEFLGRKSVLVRIPNNFAIYRSIYNNEVLEGSGAHLGAIEGRAEGTTITS
jgi:hypothetical protein